MKKYIVIFFLSLVGFAKAQCPTYTNNIVIKTGYSYTANTPANPNSTCGIGGTCAGANYGVIDNYWLVVSDNVVSTPEPRPAYAIENIAVPPALSPGWVNITGTNWICPNPFILNGVGSLGHCCLMGGIVADNYSVELQHNFSVTCTTSLVLTYSLAADETATLAINGSSIVAIAGFISATTGSLNISGYCSAGINTLKVYLKNTNGLYGFNMSGTISSASNCIVSSTCMPTALIQGKKWNDLNLNSAMDVGESGIGSYPIFLTDGTNTYTTFTGANGDYFFTGLAGGNYTVSEMALPNYSLVSPAGGTIAVTLAANQVTTGVNFFNKRCYGITGMSFNPSISDGTVCSSATLAMNTQTTSNCVGSSFIYNWNFGDGAVGTGPSQSHNYQTPGNYTLSCTMINTITPGSTTYTQAIQIVDCPSVTCKSCIGSFAPDPGDYIVSLWVKEDYASSLTVVAYTNTGISVSFSPDIGQPAIVTTYSAFGSVRSPIIDGWQRIETKINVPANAYQVHVMLLNNNGGGSGVDSYFDDIRIHPIDATMKSYVYDPVTLRLVAELDENNYSTRYEYDEEGKLVRVKKETEKGVMTIKETRIKNKKR